MKISIPPGHTSFFIWCTALGVFIFFIFNKGSDTKTKQKLIVSIDLFCIRLIFLSILLILNFLRALFLLMTLLPARAALCLCHLLQLLAQHWLTFSSLKDIAIFRIQIKGSVILRTAYLEGYGLPISSGIHSGVLI